MRRPQLSMRIGDFLIGRLRGGSVAVGNPEMHAIDALEWEKHHSSHRQGE